MNALLYKLIYFNLLPIQCAVVPNMYDRNHNAPNRKDLLSDSIQLNELPLPGKVNKQTFKMFRKASLSINFSFHQRYSVLLSRRFESMFFYWKIIFTVRHRAHARSIIDKKLILTVLSVSPPTQPTPPTVISPHRSKADQRGPSIMLFEHSNSSKVM